MIKSFIPGPVWMTGPVDPHVKERLQLKGLLSKEVPLNEKALIDIHDHLIRNETCMLLPWIRMDVPSSGRLNTIIKMIRKLEQENCSPYHLTQRVHLVLTAIREMQPFPTQTGNIKMSHVLGYVLIMRNRTSAG